MIGWMKVTYNDARASEQACKRVWITKHLEAAQ